MNQGFIVHSAIHAARHDMHCVVHCHHQPTVAVAMTETRILPMSQEIVGVFDSIRYHPFEGTALDLEERERMARSLGPNASILILENHGPLTGGASIADAMWLMCVHALLRAFSLCEDTLASYNRTCTCTYICTHTHTHTHTHRYLVTRHCEYQQQAMAAVGGDISKLLVPTDERVRKMAARSRANPTGAAYNPAKLQFESWRRRVEREWGAESIYSV
jgi:rhamnose utilization protein RhaD (predicted bifunctional aldolase and dehydrogenase)